MKKTIGTALADAKRAQIPLRQTSSSAKLLPPTGRRVANRAQRWSVREICEIAGFNPIAVMIDVIKTGRLPAIPIPNPHPENGEGPTVMAASILTDEERLKTLRDLMRYAVPSLSAIQMTGKDGGPIATAHLDVVALMSNPELAIAAQTLSLAATAQHREQAALAPPEPAPDEDKEDPSERIIDVEPEDVIDAED